MNPGNSIRSMRRSRKMTLEQVAAHIGVSAAQVSRWETKPVDIPRSRLVALAELYECGVDQILDGVGVTEGVAQPKAERSYKTVKPTRQKMRDSIPVFSSEVGIFSYEEGRVTETIIVQLDDVLHYAPRLGKLVGRHDLYAFYYRGSAMSPVYTEGELLICGGRVPPRVGDDVLFRIHPADASENPNFDMRALVLGRLHARTSSYVELIQYNPEERIRLPVDRFARLDRVLGLEDVLSLFPPDE